MVSTSIKGQKECEHLMEIAFAFCRSQCLFTAVQLGLFSLLGGKDADQREISAQLSIDERGCREFLDSLVALGLLKQAMGRYSNTFTASQYLMKGKPTYIGDWFEFMAARLYPVWGRFPAGIRTGIPQNEAMTESDYYANLGEDSIRHERFLKGMTGLSARAAEIISLRFPWSRYKSLIDLGGASGSLARELVKSHPHLSGGIFDLPAVQGFFDAFTADFSPALTFYPGNFFVDELPRADVFILGHVLHNWNMEEKQQLLSRVFEAVNAGGAIIVYEWMLDDARSKLLGLLDSLTMLLVTRTGHSISYNTCETLLGNAGFVSTGVLVEDAPYTFVVGWKQQ